MTRRVILEFIPWLIPVRSSVLHAADRHGTDLVSVANDFAAAYRDWGVIKQQELVEPGTVSVEGIRAWETVRRKFHDLDVAVRNS